MSRYLFSALLAAVLLLLPRHAFGAEWGLDDFKAAGAAVCVWEEGKAEESIKAVEALGFRVVYRSPYLSAITCRWKDALTAKMLEDLKKIPTLKMVEPAPEIFLTDEKPSEKAITNDKLDAFQWAGAMTCVWKEGQRDKAKELVKAQKLKIVYESISQPAITCRWDGVLTKEVLEALQKSDALEYVEPAPAPELIKAAEGRTIELVQGTPTIRASGNRLGCYPDDPELKKLWGMESIKAPQAWCYAKTSGLVVAVIDSGIDYNHPDIKPNMWLNPGEKPGNGIDDDKNKLTDDIHGANFVTLLERLPTADPMDGNGHGTHVAGIVGAVGNNKVGVVGVNWRVQLMALKVFDDNSKVSEGRTLALADAIFYARKGKAKVINLSLKWHTDVEIVGKQIAEAEKEGIMVVCAAGNDKNNNDTIPQYPASYPNSNIISVAAININNQLAGFSNFGSKTVHLAAPGEDVFSTYPTAKGAFKSLSGTSMAAPHVAGAVALTWGQTQHKEKGHQEIKKLLLDNVQRLDALSGKCATNGTLNIAFLNPEPPKDKPVPPPPEKLPPVYIVCPPPVIYCPCPPRPPLFYRIRCGRR